MTNCAPSTICTKKRAKQRHDAKAVSTELRRCSFDRYLIGRPIQAACILIATVTITFAQLAEANADGLAVGNQLALWELVRPDRFGWPAVFTCRRHRSDTNPAVVFAHDPDEMNERLLAAGIWPEDCHGGFSIRSARTHLGKLDEIEGDVLEQEPGPKAGQVKRVKPLGPSPSPKF
jgi:hypothetical protein